MRRLRDALADAAGRQRPDAAARTRAAVSAAHHVSAVARGRLSTASPPLHVAAGSRWATWRSPGSWPILGSGETSPTMVTPHQQLFARLGADVAAVTLDTPYGFQENADELTERVRAYFLDSVGRSVEAVRFRSRAEADADPVGHAEAMAQLLAARWVFAGPGSPSYALRQLGRARR